MRKIIVAFTFLLTTAVVGRAQFFIEGDLGITFSSHKVAYRGVQTSSHSNFIFSVSPKVGYWLNERIALGINFTYTGQPKYTNLNPSLTDESNTEYRNSDWRGSIFSRYKLFRKEKLSVFAEGSIGISENSVYSIQEPISRKTSSTTAYIFNLSPVIAYDLTDKIRICQ